MKLEWDATNERLYETGISKCVLYPRNANGAYPKGYAWNGVTSVSERPSGGETTKLYANDAKYLSLISSEEYGGSIEAYTYPNEWMACDGSEEAVEGVVIGQQSRNHFGLAYRSVLGNDTQGSDFAYKLHLIYDALASPSERSYQTINDNPDAISFSWEFETSPVPCTGHKPVSCLSITSNKVDPQKLSELEDILYGSEVPEYDWSKTYVVGDLMSHKGNPYVCNDTDKVISTTVPELPMFSYMVNEEDDSFTIYINKDKDETTNELWYMATVGKFSPEVTLNTPIDTTSTGDWYGATVFDTVNREITIDRETSYPGIDSWVYVVETDSSKKPLYYIALPVYNWLKSDNNLDARLPLPGEVLSIFQTE